MIDIDENMPFHTQLELLQDAVKTGNAPPLMFHLAGQGLVRVAVDERGWRFIALKREALAAMLRRWADPVKLKTNAAGVTTRAVLPKLDTQLVTSYLEQGHWPEVPYLSRAAEAPVVRPDLSVCWDEGYDERSQTFVVKGARPAGMIYATAESARAAGAYLLTWFDAFALQYQESRADALALALTPLLASYTRELSEANVPGGLVSATEKGSGKTELTKIISIMGAGSRVNASTWPVGAEQLKQVITILRNGQPVALFDNVKAGLDSDVLEALLTGRSMSARRLGTQESVEVVNDTLWLFTSNAPSVSPDMLRRLIIIPLLKRGSTAVWDPQITSKAEKSRDAIATAMITLVSWWASQGAPAGSVALPGYEAWSTTVSGILEAAGIAGFGRSRTETLGTSIITDEDDEGQMVERIARVMGTGTDVLWRSGNLWDAANDTKDGALLSTDRSAIRKWLDTGAKNPAMATGHKLQGLVGKDYPDVPYRLERVMSRNAAYQIVLKDPVGQELLERALGGIQSPYGTAAEDDN